MIIIRVLALSAIALTNINTGSVESETCLDILQQGESLINESSGCRLINALFNDEDILGGTPEDVKGVCDASPTCVDQLTSLISKGEDQGCKWNAIPGENGVIIDDSESIELIKKHANDVSIVTGFLCKDNCYAVTQAIEDGDMSAATCDCLLAFVEKVDKLSEDARDYLDLDAEVDREIVSAISKMGCIGNLRSSASTRVVVKEE
mmetsp:Transcript_142/g.310  ORF Transcript_142/g.310 Transcript_142/m.310 type:complete len:206 (+) Transcript_142:41-658(+)|eukprot:CAMPEP_0201874416 /NCGR_PEP_ID=MMETSP0902-20130614/6680_1 /ASSEMBLY_ACC=CAM_ASM_000551 /TAXON_ID=420261 /ORGANISM="Thalassiosira antarctica, Strain CCMP982" /LENGTH=205 /DNA_ID=CAMNT_0048401285 /DNA_START=25 /DNA_END=642 /DNA_ORIENTATION=-